MVLDAMSEGILTYPTGSPRGYNLLQVKRDDGLEMGAYCPMGNDIYLIAVRRCPDSLRRAIGETPLLRVACL